MLVLKAGDNFLHRAFGIDLGCYLLQLLLIAVQIVITDLKQPVERNIDHLVREKFVAIVLCAQAEVTFGVRQNRIMKILFITLKSVYHALISSLEIGEKLRVGYR